MPSITSGSQHGNNEGPGAEVAVVISSILIFVGVVVVIASLGLMAGVW